MHIVTKKGTARRDYRYIRKAQQGATVPMAMLGDGDRDGGDELIQPTCPTAYKAPASACALTERHSKAKGNRRGIKPRVTL